MTTAVEWRLLYVHVCTIYLYFFIFYLVVSHKQRTTSCDFVGVRKARHAEEIGASHSPGGTIQDWYPSATSATRNSLWYHSFDPRTWTRWITIKGHAGGVTFCLGRLPAEQKKYSTPFQSAAAPWFSPLACNVWFIWWCFAKKMTREDELACCSLQLSDHNVKLCLWWQWRAWPTCRKMMNRWGPAVSSTAMFPGTSSPHQRRAWPTWTMHQQTVTVKASAATVEIFKGPNRKVFQTWVEI